MSLIYDDNAQFQDEFLEFYEKELYKQFKDLVDKGVQWILEHNGTPLDIQTLQHVIEHDALDFAFSSAILDNSILSYASDDEETNDQC